jgi:hypothetical protein
MTATSCTAIEALKALRLGSKVRCIAWADGRYIEVVADRITLNDEANSITLNHIEAHILTQNSILQDFVLCDQWEILDY